jgi:chorismate mutase
MSLDHLRDHLEKITKDLIDLLLERKNLVKQIQKTKETKTKYWCYDPQREEKVFKKLKKELPRSFPL